MLTRAEKTYLALALAFFATGSGIKAWRRASVRLGPFPDPATLAQDSARAADSLARDRAGPAAEVSVPPSADTIPAPAAAAVVAPSGGIPRTRHGESALAGKVDLNRADVAGLMRVPGIGAKTAEAILAYRRAHGPFRNLRDLLQIKGIGEKRLEKLAPYIIL